MKYYAIAQLDITDPSWIVEYVTHVTPLVESHGGRYLARTPRVEVVEGDRSPRQIFLIIEWPSKSTAEAFYDSDRYRPYRDARQAGTTGEFVLVAPEDVNRVARIA